MTYSEYVAEMNHKFPNHQPMSEANFNAMERTHHKNQFAAVYQKRDRKPVQLTLENHAKHEISSRTPSRESRKKNPWQNQRLASA